MTSCDAALGPSVLLQTVRSAAAVAAVAAGSTEEWYKPDDACGDVIWCAWCGVRLYIAWNVYVCQPAWNLGLGVPAAQTTT